MIARTWFYPKDIWGLCVADGATQKVAVLTSVETRRICLMHNRDKVGASAVGKIIWKNMRVDINPFPEGNDLISKAHKLATHFCMVLSGTISCRSLQMHYTGRMGSG